MILDINIGAIIDARTPDRIRARAGGAFRFINYGVRPIGALLGGAARRRRIGVARGDLRRRRRSRRSVASCSWSGRRSCGCARLCREAPRIVRREGSRIADYRERRRAYSQRKVRSASTTAPTPQTASDERAPGRRPPRPTRARPGTRRRGPPPAAGRRAWRAVRAARRPGHDPAEQQERDEQAVGEGQGGLGPERTGQEQPEPGERERPEQEGQHEQRRRRVRPRTPAEDRGRDRHEQDDLHDLDDEDGQHLGRQQAGARQRRAAEPLQHAVVALVGGRDPEVDQAGRDDRQREGPRQEEVDRDATPRRQDRDGGEEQQDDDRDDDRDQDVLAAPRGQPQLHPGLGEGRGGQGRRAAHAHVLAPSGARRRPARGRRPRGSRRRSGARR